MFYGLGGNDVTPYDTPDGVIDVGYTTPDAIVVGDFTGDGKLDLAVADAGFDGFVSTATGPLVPINVTGGVSILLGNGDGTFQARHL